MEKINKEKERYKCFHSGCYLDDLITKEDIAHERKRNNIAGQISKSIGIAGFSSTILHLVGLGTLYALKYLKGVHYML